MTGSQPWPARDFRCAKCDRTLGQVRDEQRCPHDRCPQRGILFHSGETTNTTYLVRFLGDPMTYAVESAANPLQYGWVKARVGLVGIDVTVWIDIQKAYQIEPAPGGYPRLENHQTAA